MEQIKLTDKTLDKGAFYIYVLASKKSMSFRYMASTAQLLSCLPDVTEELDRLRVKYCIKLVPIIDVVDKQFTSLDLDVYYKLARGAEYRFRPDYVADLEKFTNLHNIGDEWYDIITVLLQIEAVLIIMPPGLEVHRPGGLPRMPTTRKNNQIEITIYINRQMAISELAEAIRLNRNVKVGLSKLPKYPKTKISEETMLWGHRVWALMKFNPNKRISYVTLIKQLDLVYEGVVPDRIELQKHYKGFYTALKTHL